MGREKAGVFDKALSNGNKTEIAISYPCGWMAILHESDLADDRADHLYGFHDRATAKWFPEINMWLKESCFQWKQRMNQPVHGNSGNRYPTAVGKERDWQVKIKK